MRPHSRPVTSPNMGRRKANNKKNTSIFSTEEFMYDASAAAAMKSSVTSSHATTAALASLQESLGTSRQGNKSAAHSTSAAAPSPNGSKGAVSESTSTFLPKVVPPPQLSAPSEASVTRTATFAVPPATVTFPTTNGTSSDPTTSSPSKARPSFFRRRTSVSSAAVRGSLSATSSGPPEDPEANETSEVRKARLVMLVQDPLAYSAAKATSKSVVSESSGTAPAKSSRVSVSTTPGTSVSRQRGLSLASQPRQSVAPTTTSSFAVFSPESPHRAPSSPLGVPGGAAPAKLSPDEKRAIAIVLQYFGCQAVNVPDMLLALNLQPPKEMIFSASRTPSLTTTTQNRPKEYRSMSEDAMAPAGTVRFAVDGGNTTSTSNATSILPVTSGPNGGKTADWSRRSESGDVSVSQRRVDESGAEVTPGQWACRQYLLKHFGIQSPVITQDQLNRIVSTVWAAQLLRSTEPSTDADSSPTLLTGNHAPPIPASIVQDQHEMMVLEAFEAMQAYRPATAVPLGSIRSRLTSGAVPGGKNPTAILRRTVTSTPTNVPPPPAPQQPPTSTAGGPFSGTGGTSLTSYPASRNNDSLSSRPPLGPPAIGGRKDSLLSSSLQGRTILDSIARTDSLTQTSLQQHQNVGGSSSNNNAPTADTPPSTAVDAATGGSPPSPPSGKKPGGWARLQKHRISPSTSMTTNPAAVAPRGTTPARSESPAVGGGAAAAAVVTAPEIFFSVDTILSSIKNSSYYQVQDLLRLVAEDDGITNPIPRTTGGAAAAAAKDVKKPQDHEVHRLLIRAFQRCGARWLAGEEDDLMIRGNTSGGSNQRHGRGGPSSRSGAKNNTPASLSGKGGKGVPSTSATGTGGGGGDDGANDAEPNMTENFQCMLIQLPVHGSRNAPRSVEAELASTAVKQRVVAGPRGGDTSYLVPELPADATGANIHQQAPPQGRYELDKDALRERCAYVGLNDTQTMIIMNAFTEDGNPDDSVSFVQFCRVCRSNWKSQLGIPNDMHEPLRKVLGVSKDELALIVKTYLARIATERMLAAMTMRRRRSSLGGGGLGGGFPFGGGGSHGHSSITMAIAAAASGGAQVTSQPPGERSPQQLALNSPSSAASPSGGVGRAVSPSGTTPHHLLRSTVQRYMVGGANAALKGTDSDAKHFAEVLTASGNMVEPSPSIAVTKNSRFGSANGGGAFSSSPSADLRPNSASFSEGKSNSFSFGDATSGGYNLDDFNDSGTPRAGDGTTSRSPRHGATTAGIHQAFTLQRQIALELWEEVKNCQTILQTTNRSKQFRRLEMAHNEYLAKTAIIAGHSEARKKAMQKKRQQQRAKAFAASFSQEDSESYRSSSPGAAGGSYRTASPGWSQSMAMSQSGASPRPHYDDRDGLNGTVTSMDLEEDDGDYAQDPTMSAQHGGAGSTKGYMGRQRQKKHVFHRDKYRKERDARFHLSAKCSSNAATRPAYDLEEDQQNNEEPYEEDHDATEEQHPQRHEDHPSSKPTPWRDASQVTPQPTVMSLWKSSMEKARADAAAAAEAEQEQTCSRVVFPDDETDDREGNHRPRRHQYEDEQEEGDNQGDSFDETADEEEPVVVSPSTPDASPKPASPRTQDSPISISYREDADEATKTVTACKFALVSLSLRWNEQPLPSDLLLAGTGAAINRTMIPPRPPLKVTSSGTSVLSSSGHHHHKVPPVKMPSSARGATPKAAPPLHPLSHLLLSRKPVMEDFNKTRTALTAQDYQRIVVAASTEKPSTPSSATAVGAASSKRGTTAPSGAPRPPPATARTSSQRTSNEAHQQNGPAKPPMTSPRKQRSSMEEGNPLQDDVPEDGPHTPPPKHHRLAEAAGIHPSHRQSVDSDGVSSNGGGRTRTASVCIDERPISADQAERPTSSSSGRVGESRLRHHRLSDGVDRTTTGDARAGGMDGYNPNFVLAANMNSISSNNSSTAVDNSLATSRQMDSRSESKTSDRTDEPPRRVVASEPPSN